MGLAAALDRVVDRLEGWDASDAVSDAVSRAVRGLVPAGRAENLASGTPLAHPLHPVLVGVPIGTWTAVPVLDALAADDQTTRRVVGLGLLAAVPTAYTGIADWLTTSGAERRVGLVHALANSGALVLQTASWQARRTGARGRGAALSLAALALTGVAGWLGGHLAYALGVGVDTTVFQHLPPDWTDTVAESEVTDGLTRCDVGGVPIVIFRVDGRIVALADRCTHRGGPLHEGELADGCITCPWHGSVFDADGLVRSGPASRPQPSLETRVVNGRVQMRWQTQRTLRTNPVGA
jgi:nitrite reductase/ring-hydroxylating ferredoxin subunit/uncharacterized membrane protein